MNELARRWPTVAQAAELTGRSERTIRRWITEGRLIYRELEGVRYVNELALLTVERATRQAARAGRPGPRSVHMLDDLRSGGLESPIVGPMRPPVR